MYYTGDYEAETLPLLKQEYIDNTEEFIFDSEIGGLFYQHPNGTEVELSQCQTNRFIDEVNDCILNNIQADRDEREHQRLERVA